MDVTSYLLGKKAGGSEVNNQNKDVTITENGTSTVTADAGYTGLGTVGISTNVQPNLESKSETITTNTTTTITPTQGKDGLSQVNVTTNVQPDLETKSVTITENGTTTVTPTTGKDGLSQVSITANVPTGDLSEYFNDTVENSNQGNVGWISLIKKIVSPIYTNSMSYLFYNYKGTSVPQIYFSGSSLNTSEWLYSFSGLKNVSVLDLENIIKTPTFLTTNINLGSAFSSSTFNSINIGRIFENYKISSLSYTFNNCTNISSLDLSYLDTTPAATIDNIFQGCTSLTSITGLNNFNTSNVTNMSSAFRNCQSLVTLNISNFDMGKVINISNFISTNETPVLENLTFGYDLGKGYLTTKSAHYSNYKLDLSTQTALTHDSLMSVINNLYDIATAGVQTQDLILGATNLAKLSASEIAIATNKGWAVS